MTKTIDLTQTGVGEDILDEKQEVDERLKTLVRVFQTADRIITGEKLRLQLVEAGIGLPVAWTDGQVIFLNANRLGEADWEVITEVYGVNFHEVAHVEHTPRKGTSIVAWVLDHNYQQAFNILEDQKIESLSIANYASMRAWFTASVAKWIIQSPEFVPEHGYLFVRGRRYLDGRLRGALRAAFVRQDLLPEVDRIIDAYRLTVFPTDYLVAQQLIEDFHNLIQQIVPPGQGQGLSSCPHGHGKRTIEILVQGRPRSLQQQRRANARLTDGEPEQEPDITVLLDLDDDDAESEADEPGDPGDDDGDGEGEGDQPGSSPVGGRKAGTGPSAEQIIDLAARKTLAVVLENDEVRADIRRALRQIRGGTGSDIIEKANWRLRDPLPQYRAQYGAMHRMLTRLAMKADPGWETHEDHGKVNVLRWSQEHDISTAFDAWDEGVNDAIDMEVVIEIDESGSMGGRFEEAANAMWVVKRALDKIGASCTVITFSDKCRVLYHRDEKAEAQYRWSYSGGGTVPATGMAQAARIFARTRKTQKILIVFTDGEWSDRLDEDGVGPDEYIRRMTNGGVQTALGFIRDSAYHHGEPRDSHNCSMSRSLDVASLVPFMQSIVTETIKQRLLLR